MDTISLDIFEYTYSIVMILYGNTSNKICYIISCLHLIYEINKKIKGNIYICYKL